MSKNTTAPIEPEFSYTLAVDKVSGSGLTLTLEANETQRAGLAKRFALLALDRLTAKLTVTPQSSEPFGFLISGTLEAKATQQCGVTLEPLPVKIKADLNVTCIETTEEAIENGEIDLALDVEDIEPIVNRQIDVGELVAQHFGLALDPYPRKEGLSPVEEAYGEDDVPENPFAKLIDLKKKDTE